MGLQGVAGSLTPADLATAIQRGAVTASQVEQHLANLEKQDWAEQRRRLFYYRPYPKQYAFHAEGARFRERLLLAGNQTGKTLSAAMEVAMHMTGEYPEWWVGRRFDHPVTAWTGSETNESSREIVQHQLLGCERADLDDEDMGTGAIPLESIVAIKKRQAGVTDVAESITVRHKGGGLSRCLLKSYDQGRTKWQGKPHVDIVWFDEEPSHEIYSEGVTRTSAVSDAVIMITFTPLKGTTSVVEAYLSPQPGDSPKSVTGMEIWDAVGGIWPEGTFWEGEEWAGHYTGDDAEKRIAAYPSHERETRARGVPMMGEGRVFPVDEDQIKVAPFEMPRHWARICAIDFGIDHPFAAVWVAHDRDADVVYVYDCFRMVGETPIYHAAAITKRSTWIPVVWPHDGLNKEKGTGVVLKDMYASAGLHKVLLHMSARYRDDKGGSQEIEPAVVDIYERILTERFRVFSNLS